MSKKSFKKGLLTGASAFALGAFAVTSAFAAVQTDNLDNGSSTSLNASNSAKFEAPAAGVDEIFTVGDGVDVGDGTSGQVVEADTADGVGTLTFEGDSIATGNIGASGNNLGVLNAGVTGKSVTITGQVNANQINITNDGTVTFQDNVTGGATPTITFNNDGTVNISDDAEITADITTDNAGSGTLEFLGDSKVTGEVGVVGANELGLITINGGAVTTSGDVAATTIDFADDGSLSIADGKEIEGDVTSANGSEGTLILEQGATITGEVGTVANSIKQLTVGNTTAGTVDASGNIYADNTEFKTDSTLQIDGGKNISGTVTVNGDDQGTIEVATDGNVTIGGNIGTSTSLDLGELDAAAITDGNTLTLSGTDNFIATTTIGAGQADINGNLTGNVTFESAGTTGSATFANGNVLTGDVTTDTNDNGALVFEQDGTVTGEIGATGKALNEFNVGTVLQGAVTTSGDIFATTTNVNNDSTLSLTAGKNITGAVETDNGGDGTLTFTGTGANSTVSGNIGTGAASFGTLNNITTADGDVLTLDGADNYISTINVGAGQVQLDGDLTGNVAFDAAAGTTGAITIADGENLVGNVTAAEDGEGNVNFAGSTNVTGAIGVIGVGNNINQVTVNAGNVTVSENVAASTINFAADGSLTIADTKTLEGDVTSTNGSEGKLNVTQNGTVTGNIGAVGKTLSEFNIGTGAQGTTSTSGNIYADVTDINNDSTLQVAAGNTVGGTITTDNGGDGTVTITGNGNTSITGNVGTGAAALGTLNNITTVDGEVLTIGGADNYINTTNIGAGQVQLDGDLTGNVAFDAAAGTTGAITIADGENLVGNVTAAEAGEGNVNFAGTSTLTGDIGVVGANELNAVTINAGAVTATGDVAATTINFADDGSLSIANGNTVEGAVTSANASEGTLILEQGATITGEVGVIGTNIKQLVVGNTTAGTVDASGNIYADNVDFQTASTLQIDGGKNIAGTVTTDADDQGTIEVATDGNVTIGGNIGTSTSLDLGELDAAAITDGNTLTLSGTDNFIATTTIGAGQADINGNLTGNIAFESAGTTGSATFANGNVLTGNVTTDTTTNGKLIFEQDGTVTGDIGSKAGVLNEFTVGSLTSGTVSVAGDIYATDTNLATDSILSIDNSKSDIVSGTITVANDGEGTVTVTGTGSDINLAGNVGTATEALGTLNNIAGADGDVVTLTGAANYINVTNIGAGQVDLDGDLTGNVNFDAAANATGAILIADGENLTGDVTAAEAGEGNVTFEGVSTLTGDIGVVGANEIGTVTITGANAVTTTGDIAATTVNFTGNGELQVADGKNLEADITAANANEGTLTFAGNTTVTGDIGVVGANELNTVTITGANTLTTTGDIAATTINFVNDGTLSVADGATVEGAVTAATANEGNVNFVGAATVTGSLGETGSDEELKLVTINGGDVSVSGDVAATTVNFAGDSNLTLADGAELEGAVTTATNDTGAVIFDQGGTVTGNIGTATEALNAFVIGDTTAGTVTTTGNIYATTTEFASDSILNVTGGKMFGGDFTTTVDGNGTLTVTGTGSDTTIAGQIGSSTLALGTLNNVAGSSTDQLTLGNTGTNYIDTINIGAGQVDLQGALVGDVNFDASASTTGAVTVADGKSVTGNVTTATAGQGIVNIAGGSTITGTIGDGGNEIARINLNGDSTKSVTFTDDINADAIVLADDSSVVIAGDVNTDTDVTAGITNSDDGEGTITFTGTSNVGNTNTTDAIGTNTNDFKAVNINTTNTVTIDGNVYSDGVNFGADGILSLLDGANLGNGAVGGNDITTTTTNTGTLRLAGNTNTVVNGDIGSSTASLKEFDIDSAAQVSVAGDIYATEVTLSDAASELVIADGKNVNGDIIATASNVGIITASGATAFNGSLGSASNSLNAINIDSTDSTDTVTFTENAFANSFDATGSDATISIAQDVTIEVNNAVSAAQSGNGVYKHFIKNVDGGADEIGQIKITGAGNSFDATGASFDVQVASDTDFIATGDTFVLVDGDAAGTANAGGATAVDNSYILDFTIAANGGDLQAVANRVNAFNTASSNFNENSVGAALESIGATSDSNVTSVQGALQNITMSGDVENALETLTPDVSGVIANASRDAAAAGFNTVDDRIDLVMGVGKSGVAAGNHSHQNGVWGEVFGATSEQDERDNVQGYEADTFGFGVGYDKEVMDDTVVGVSAAYANTDGDSANGDTDIDSYQLSVYGARDYGQWYSNAMLGFTHNSFDTTRNINVGSIADVASADFDGQQYTAKIGGGYKLAPQHGFNIIPVASLKYDFLTFDSYTETGSTANLTVDNDDLSILVAEIGANVNYPIYHGDTTFIPEVRASYAYDFIGDEQTSVANFVGVASTQFTSRGADIAQSIFNVGAGLDVLTQDTVTVSFDYDFTAREDFDSHGGSLRARFEF